MLLMAVVSFIGGCMGHYQHFILAAMALVAAAVLAPEQKKQPIKRRYY